MTPEQFNELSIDGRAEALNAVADEAIDSLVLDDYELPTPWQVCHMDYERLPRPYRFALSRAP